MTDRSSIQPSLPPFRLSRRAFLGGLGVIIAGSTWFAARQTQLLGPDASLDELLSILQRSTFARFVGDTFHLTLDTETRGDLSLTTVRDLGIKITFSSEEQARAYQEASFSILFRGPVDRPLPQGTYTVEHARIGIFPLFIVPTQSTQDARHYEATFNRIPA